MKVDAFDFDLPPQLIALRPAEPREAARLLRVAPGGTLTDHTVGDLPDLLRPGDLMVVNDTRVIPARLRGVRRRGEAAAKVETMLHLREAPDRWRAFLRPAKKVRTGERLEFGDLGAEVTALHGGGEATLRFDRAGDDLDAAIAAAGELPLPPYIEGQRPVDERDRADYQTAYADEPGAVAAPTAGLHLTPDLLARLDAAGVERVAVTLHVGAGTFLPVKADDTDDHGMHAEWGRVTHEAAAAIDAARGAGRRVVAVGTTSLRILESAAGADGRVAAWSGTTDIFIMPGYRFRAVDALMTNFHLPRSTLFMLVSAFSGMATMRAPTTTRSARLPLLLLRRRLPAGACRGERMTPFGFTLHATDGAARRGTVHTARGDIRTPAFMPVGTAGTVKAMTMDRVRQTGADIILGNTYHLMLRPTAERIARLGGLHEFARWDRPILTDSGGFQVMSLAALRKLDDEGVVFKSHIDGTEHAMSPERSIEIQGLLGSDIQMQLDELVSLPNERPVIERAMERSLRWAERCATAFGDQPERALFGIVQGGDQPDLRRRSAEALVAMDLKGYAIGGLAVGEDRATMLAIVEATEPHLPATKPTLHDGRRHAARPAAIGGAGRGHVRLRHADPLGAARAGLHHGRPGEPAQRAPRRRSAPARPDHYRLPGKPRLLPRLPQPPRALERAARLDPADVAQPRLLPAPHAGHARRDRGGPLRRACGGGRGGLGAGRRARALNPAPKRPGSAPAARSPLPTTARGAPR